MQGIQKGSYLDIIHCHQGLRPDEFDDWEKRLSRYRGKAHLPLINFPASPLADATKIREKMLEMSGNLLHRNLGLKTDEQSAVSYLISEMTDNIVEHSGAARGWLAAQHYPRKGYLDLCSSDTGLTVLGSYQGMGFEDVLNDEIAIERALLGVSTKDRERGFGIRTSHSMIVEGLKGSFLLVSGQGMLFNNDVVPITPAWPGTLLALRLYQNIEGFRIMTFVNVV